MEEAERLARGGVLLFGDLELDTGFPPAWHRNHLQRVDAPAGEHWSRLSDFAYGDIKLIWELSRFPFAFALARAYARTGREEFAETFWTAVEDWLAANPPQAGVNWKCGQEISLRLMAWCFGLHAFLQSPATSGQRLLRLAFAMNHFGERIEANLAYALSQSNNHGISEAAGLFTLGVLFPELRGAGRWRKLGRLHLEEQAIKLIYADGGFPQQSPNYHRLVLQLYTWTLGLARLNGDDFSPELGQRLRAALNWSLQLMETANGRMPCSGGHDGAHFLPLSNCAHGDHRPTLQALAYLLDGELPFAPGPWDEQALWLCGPVALESPRRPRPPADFWHGEGGFHVLRNPDSWAVLRCGPYLHRPVHADLLHLDLWWRGRNLALDPGSYSYNPEGDWEKGLAGTEFHNTVSVAGQDQMGRAARFMWLPWAHSSLLGSKRSPTGRLAWLEGIHSGYRRLAGGPLHRRNVLSINGQWWLVLDFVVDGEHPSRLHWLLADAPHVWDPAAVRLSLDYPEGGYQVVAGAGVEGVVAELVRADPASPRGWCSPTYQVQREALSLSLSAPPGSPGYFSALGPAGFDLERRGEDLILTTEQFRALVQLRPAAGPVLASSGLAVLEGENEDCLSFS
ncbi:MAG: heparinase II/III family protein [Desulfarculaceae bacterium]|nr:heparinase II/III family protein [Desulfarculaceae bacterium]MCF8118298.1 heparinase II/III family protein [Desulfarculaceae bacterium]